MTEGKIFSVFLFFIAYLHVRGIPTPEILHMTQADLEANPGIFNIKLDEPLLYPSTLTFPEFTFFVELAYDLEKFNSKL